jgi:hypothetical protein
MGYFFSKPVDFISDGDKRIQAFLDLRAASFSEKLEFLESSISGMK